MELLFINPGPCPGFRGRLSDQFRDERSISVLSGRYWILTVDLEFRWRGPSEDRAGEPGPATPSMVRHSRHYCRLISKLPAVRSLGSTPAFGCASRRPRSVRFPQGQCGRVREGVALEENDLGGLRFNRGIRSPTRSPSGARCRLSSQRLRT